MNDHMKNARRRGPWASSRAAGGPLSTLGVLELGGIGPGPVCAMLLADLGADVIRVDRPSVSGAPNPTPVLHRNRRSITIDFKQPAGADLVRLLAEDADIVLEGFPPGVAERLGVGPDDLIGVNPPLVYGRMTGWGQTGPMAQQAGYDINYIALSEALHAVATPEQQVLPPHSVGDFGADGMLLARGVLGAVQHARRTGQGQVVDAAIIDGTAALLATTYGLLSRGLWRDQRAANLLAGSSPVPRRLLLRRRRAHLRRGDRAPVVCRTPEHPRPDR